MHSDPSLSWHLLTQGFAWKVCLMSDIKLETVRHINITGMNCPWRFEVHNVNVRSTDMKKVTTLATKGRGNFVTKIMRFMCGNLGIQMEEWKQTWNCENCKASPS